MKIHSININCLVFILQWTWRKWWPILVGGSGSVCHADTNLGELLWKTTLRQNTLDPQDIIVTFARSMSKIGLLWIITCHLCIDTRNWLKVKNNTFAFYKLLSWQGPVIRQFCFKINVTSSDSFSSFSQCRWLSDKCREWSVAVCGVWIPSQPGKCQGSYWGQTCWIRGLRLFIVSNDFEK